MQKILKECQRPSHSAHAFNSSAFLGTQKTLCGPPPFQPLPLLFSQDPGKPRSTQEKSAIIRFVFWQSESYSTWNLKKLAICTEKKLRPLSSSTGGWHLGHLCGSLKHPSPCFNAPMSHNQNPILRWSTQSHGKSSKGGRAIFVAGIVRTTLQLPGF